MNIDREKLLRYIEGTLTDTDALEIRVRLETDSELRRDIDRLVSVQQALIADKPESFAPFFVDRVMKRLSPSTIVEVESLYDSLRWFFVRAALACLLVAIVIGTYNVLSYQGLEVAGSFVEALFGLPSATLSDALAYGSL